MTAKNATLKIVANIFIFLMVFLAVYPLILMIFGSFKTNIELSANPSGIPIDPTIINYAKLFTFSGGMIAQSLLNSVYVSAVTTALTLFLSALAAFAFSKYKFKGRNVIFLLLFSTMLIPVELIIPPLYIIFSKINWLNSYSVQIFPFIANVFALFMMKQFMTSIPDSIIESARIDGAGHLRIFFYIILPCSTPVISVLGILVFLNRWGEYLWPSLMISRTRYAPIMQVLPILSDGSGIARSVPWEVILAGCTIITIPVIIVFYIFQDKFMSGVTLGAVKE